MRPLSVTKLFVVLTNWTLCSTGLCDRRSLLSGKYLTVKYITGSFFACNDQENLICVAVILSAPPTVGFEGTISEEKKNNAECKIV